jgi:hypothetical protein
MSIKNIDETFKSILNQTQTLTQKEARKIVGTLVTELREATPLDTGLAKSSWAVQEAPGKFNITNDTKYIQYLNSGSSKQAPPYFIEATALKYGKPLGTIVQVTSD